MKEILRSFLIFVMLMPALACGPFMHSGKAQAAAVRIMPQDCHAAAAFAAKRAGDEPAPYGDAVMLFKDCAKIDLSGADDTVFQKPDLKIAKIFYDSSAVLASYRFTPAAFPPIRGPPPETVKADSYPPVYLTTQRLRI